MLGLSSGMLLGWSLGANDGANVFGTAVSARIITFSKAALLAAIFILAGAYLEGYEGMKTLGNLGQFEMRHAVLASGAAALTVLIMTVRGMPVSTSQAMVGAILGVGLGLDQIELRPLVKIVLCWIATPIGAIGAACIIYLCLGWLLRLIPMGILTRDTILWSGLVVAGVYGAYALGANNVANAVGIFCRPLEGIMPRWQLALVGGGSMALGLVMFGRGVMMTVGAKLVRLNAFSALVAVLAEAVTVHFFAWIGVPVSTSQAIIGGVIGVGLMRGGRGLHGRVLRSIVLAWTMTPLTAAVLAAAAFTAFG